MQAPISTDRASTGPATAEAFASVARQTPSNADKANIWLSPLVLAVAFLIALNAYLSYTQPLSKIDPESLPAARTWVWWATKEYLSMQPPPSVVLLGSSLVMHSISRLDADYLNQDLDYVHHHTSAYLKDKLGAGCFNFALPGGMMSDDYIVARALFKGKRKPKEVVLGLSLRDFIDNGVHCAGTTPAFRYLQRYTNIDDLVGISMPQIWQRLDYWLGKYIYLWGKKLELQVWLSQTTDRLLHPLAAKISVPGKLGDLDLERNLPVNLRSEVEEGMFIVKAHQPYSFDDNTGEYKKRYRSANPSLFKIQTRFLEMLLQYCNSNGIKVIVVNMPITQQNLTLMPAGSYGLYLHALQSESQQAHCKFVDLNTAGKFTPTDFYDTSHMNGTGGKKFADALLQEMSHAQSQ